MLEALKQFDKEGGAIVDLDIPSVYDHLAYSEYSVRHYVNSCINKRLVQ